ncbi:phosphoribosyltransferase family protein [uncultured Brevundimonas sp.]|uniref:phosphoribosyltransferase n=1 Tax=uncultured Brevundimonas sp. TaxID=213418 RepID=UPI0030EED371|tara:strand:- start:284 stop:955 length:672 start_codon:yes stop_codon:yes gene_type:complete
MTVQRPLFADRTEAGRQLAEQVVASGETDAIVYALPRGGVPVALEVARALDAPLDLVLVRKIGAPGHPEVALAAVVDGGFPQMVVNEAVQRMSGASPLYLAREKALALAEIERRRRLYFGNRTHPDPAGKTVILVDDGLATGATARVAIQQLRARGAGRVILAVPVMPETSLATLRAEVDLLICLASPVEFRSVGAFYADFHQVADDEVLAQLVEAAGFDGEA